MSKKSLSIGRHTGKPYTTIHGRRTLHGKHARGNPYNVAIDDALGLSLDDWDAATPGNATGGAAAIVLPNAAADAEGHEQ